MSSLPSNDDNDEFLLSCRYGDLDDIKQYVDKFGKDPLNSVRDEHRNTALHMVCANGHIDVLNYLLHHVTPSLLSAQNDALSTPLHWAALNAHLPIVKKLVEFPDGPGIELIDIKNAAGKSPLGVAENVGWDEGAKWLVGMMKLDTDEVKEQEGETAEDVIDPSNIEVEIEDAEGQVAKMTINSGRGARDVDVMSDESES